MRLPFDLIAALLAVEALGREFHHPQKHGGSQNLWGALLLFWLAVWLMHELVARATEWRTRFGHLPQGVPDAEGKPPRLHPMEFHARWTLLAQAASVLLFAFFLYEHRWPQQTKNWPAWAGLTPERLQGWFDGTVEQGREWAGRLRNSNAANGFLDLFPFLVAMLVSWIPKRRLLDGRSSSRIKLSRWLGFEARLTLLPFFCWMLMGLFADAWNFGMPFAPEPVRRLASSGAVQALVLLGALAFFFLAGVPFLIVRLWQCRPLPEGELKERLNALMARSGVRTRAILVWGPQGLGFANACVLGPWGPMRYVLISPGLSESLSLEECEAVVAHELGHARHGHLALLGVLLVGLVSLGTIATQWADSWSPLEQSALFLLLIVLYFRLFFGAVSRACEREADLASAELVGTPLPLMTALVKIALMAGGIQHVYSWHHDSIAKRVERLMRDGLDRDRIARYHARLRRFRMAFTVLVALAAACAVLLAMDVQPVEKKSGRTAEIVAQDQD